MATFETIRGYIEPHPDTVVDDISAYNICATYIEFCNQGSTMVQINERRIMPGEYYKFDTQPGYIWKFKCRIKFSKTDTYADVLAADFPEQLERGNRLLVTQANIQTEI